MWSWWVRLKKEKVGLGETVPFRLIAQRSRHDEASTSIVGGVLWTSLHLGENVTFHLNSKEKELMKGLMAKC